ncbi:MAG TPA: trehalose-6-phosphate synthase, partial [Acidimicrobiales bacterium]|nr:trehalose-6-phosphate synthase [Acidimicrobiales bacterium]
MGDDGELTARRGAGGLVSSLGPLARETGATWIASAISEGDREAASREVDEAEGHRVRLLALDLDEYRMAYDVVSNATLWFLHHGMFDLPRRPRLDRRWREAWAAYRAMNLAFARVLIDEAPEGATVLVQDYHLSLVGTWLAQERRDLNAVHFTHTPFCEPGALRVLPTNVAEELLVGMSSHTSCGFHARRWAANFEECCAQVLGWRPATFVSPMAPDHDDIEGVAASDECANEAAELDEQLGDRMLILRVDRIELSKNLLRGFLAYDDLLRTHPEWRGRVVFAALIYPSREGLPEYLAYRQEVETLARHLNETWGTPGWTPVMVDTSDNFPRSVAALRRYDVLLVNPIRDGLNLVAKEGAVLNANNGVLALSRDAGAWEELGGVALEVNPFDVSGTA